MNKNFNFEIAGSQFVTREGKLVGPFEKLEALVLHNTLNIWKCKTTEKHYCESGAEIDIETKKAFYNTKKSTILHEATAMDIQAIGRTDRSNKTGTGKSNTLDEKIKNNQKFGKNKTNVEFDKNKIKSSLEFMAKKFVDSNNGNLFNFFGTKIVPKLNPECDCPSCQASRLSLSNGINTTLVNNIFAVYNYMIDGLKVDKFILIDLPDMKKTPVLLQRIILQKLLKDYAKYSNNDTKTLESLIDIEQDLSDVLIEKLFTVDDFLKQHNIMSKADRNQLSNNEQNNLDEFAFANFLHRESKNKADQSRGTYIDIIMSSITDLENFKKLKVLINDDFRKFENADLKMFKDFIVNLCIEAPKYTKVKPIIIHLNIEEYLDNDDSPISIAINKYPSKKEIRKASDKMWMPFEDVSDQRKLKDKGFRDLKLLTNFTGKGKNEVIAPKLMRKLFSDEVLEQFLHNIFNDESGSIIVPRKYDKVLGIIITKILDNKFEVNVKRVEDQAIINYTSQYDVKEEKKFTIDIETSGHITKMDELDEDKLDDGLGFETLMNNFITNSLVVKIIPAEKLSSFKHEVTYGIHGKIFINILHVNLVNRINRIILQSRFKFKLTIEEWDKDTIMVEYIPTVDRK